MEHSEDISGLRKDYKMNSFGEADAAADPFMQFSKWWKEAAQSEIVEYNAMTLCTATKEGKPSGRIVLLKGFDEEGFTFYTNLESRKGEEVLANPQVSLVFFWKELERQIRIEGRVKAVSEEVSTTYFHGRPVSSQIGAWASPQSKIIPDRNLIETNHAFFKNKFSSIEVPKPPFWGGFKVLPEVFEFWQGRESRLHDRLQYSLLKPGAWQIHRLAP